MLNFGMNKLNIKNCLAVKEDLNFRPLRGMPTSCPTQGVLTYNSTTYSFALKSRLSILVVYLGMIQAKLTKLRVRITVL